MKKILAIMLIAVIAVAGVFATMSANPSNVVLNYTVTDKFTSNIGFKVTIGSGSASDYTNTAVNAGTAQSKIESGSVKLDIYDMSYCNSAVAKYSYVTITKPAAWIDKDNVATLATFSIDADHPLTAITTGDSAAGTTTSKVTVNQVEQIKVAYPQSQIVDRTGTAVQIGTVTYKWEEDAEVVTGTATATFALAYTAL
jgi:hypothetical protein